MFASAPRSSQTRRDGSSNKANAPYIMKLAPQAMYAGYLKQYTVSPDRTVIGAFEDLITLYGNLKHWTAEKNPYSCGPVRYSDQEVTLVLLKDGRAASEIRIPRPLDLGDALRSMQEWLAAMDDANPLLIAAAAHGEGWKDKVGFALADFNRLDPRLIMRGLLNLDELWQEQGPDPRILLSAVRGYAALLFGIGPDPMEYTDGFASRALALLALAKKLDPTLPAAREEAFVSMILGYTAHAGRVLDSVDDEILGPVDRAFEAYIRRDLDALSQHLREDAEILELYLLARLYREMGLYQEAENVTAVLISQFPQLYPAIVEIIYSADLAVAKYLTIVYPLEILARLEGQVTPDAIEDAATWKQRIAVIAGSSSEGNVSFSQFEDLLAKWEPLKGYGRHEFLIDAEQVKQVFRTLYTGAVYLRFNVLQRRWAVLDRAIKYAGAFANADPDHPLAMFMQIKVQIDSGNRRAAEDLCEKVIRHPQASSYIASRAHYFIQDELRRIKATPRVVSKMDSRPDNLVNLGPIFARLDHYDFSEKYYSLALIQDPYSYRIYTRLARVTGNDEPILAALDKYSDSFEMLEAAGDYYVEKEGQYSIEKAADFYRRATGKQPTSHSLAGKWAEALRKLKRYEEALRVLQDWIARNGGNNLVTTAYRSRMARIYLDMGDPDKALKTLAEDMDSFRAGTMLIIAKAYTMLNEIEAAESIYRQAVDRYPQGEHVLSGAAAFFWDQGRDDEASALIAGGRRIKGDYSQWYFNDFFKVFSRAPKDRILTAVENLKATGASSWEMSSLAHYFAGYGRHDIALEILNRIPPGKTMARLELAVGVYETIRRWQGEEAARLSLSKAVSPQQYDLLAMILFKRGHNALLMELIQKPDSFKKPYREFLWLLKLMAWMAENKQPAGLRGNFISHYKASSRDYYHAIGRYMLGELSQNKLLSLIKTPKQRCEFSYYIGFAERARGNFPEAANWYQICRETLLSNNGEFHWASEELFWWIHVGTHNRHRLVSDDIRAYEQKYTWRSSV